MVHKGLYRKKNGRKFSKKKKENGQEYQAKKAILIVYRGCRLTLFMLYYDKILPNQISKNNKWVARRNSNVLYRIKEQQNRQVNAKYTLSPLWLCIHLSCRKYLCSLREYTRIQHYLRIVGFSDKRFVKFHEEVMKTMGSSSRSSRSKTENNQLNKGIRIHYCALKERNQPFSCTHAPFFFFQTFLLSSSFYFVDMNPRAKRKWNEECLRDHKEKGKTVGVQEKKNVTVHRKSLQILVLSSRIVGN